MMRLRWHLTKASLLSHLLVLAGFAGTVVLLFVIARLEPDLVLAALSPLQAATWILDQAGQVGVFATILTDRQQAHLGNEPNALAAMLNQTTIVLGILFGAAYDLLLPRTLTLVTRRLRTDQRTAAELLRESRTLHDRLGSILFRILFALYFLYVSDIGSRFADVGATGPLGTGASSQLLVFGLITYLISAVFFSGLFGLVRRTRQQLADSAPATRQT